MTQVDEKPAVTTKDLIAKKATALFREKGYHLTTMGDIAAAVGIVKGGLYNHFPAKQDILRHVVEEWVSLKLPGFEFIVASSLPAEERLRQLLRAQIIDAIERTDAGWVFFFELRYLPAEIQDKMRQLVRKRRKMFQQVIAEGVEAGVFSVPNPKIAAQNLVRMCDSIGWIYNRTGPFSFEQIANQTVDMLFNGLLARGHKDSS